MPRDRAGTFTPRLVRKGQRRLDGLDAMIISLYAGGIEKCGISSTTWPPRSAWSSAWGPFRGSPTRPAEAVPRVAARVRWRSSTRWSTTGAIRVKVRVDHRVASRSAHIAVGVDMDGIKHVLGIWVQAGEGASFWAHVCAELANRGVKDVLIVCCDGLTGLPEAIEATWPQATVQTCVVHLIRASMRFVSYGDRRKVAAALKAVYTAPSQEAAWQALTDFSESDMGVKYPQTVATCQRAWERFTPFLDFPPMLRRVISPPLRGRYPLHQRIETASYQPR